MIESFMAKHATPQHPRVDVPGYLKQLMLNAQWPGNVRQLENVVRKILVLRDPELVAAEFTRGELRPRDAFEGEDPRTMESMIARVPSKAYIALDGASTTACELGDVEPLYARKLVSPPSILEKVDDARREAETEAILAALQSCLWNRKQAALLLRVDYKALLYKMKKLGIGDRPLRAVQ